MNWRWHTCIQPKCSDIEWSSDSQTELYSAGWVLIRSEYTQICGFIDERFMLQRVQIFDLTVWWISVDFLLSEIAPASLAVNSALTSEMRGGQGKYSFWIERKTLRESDCKLSPGTKTSQTDRQREIIVCLPSTLDGNTYRAVKHFSQYVPKRILYFS